jgi:menaquinone-dependent protoporphyrinogen IX oxidase
MHILVTYSSGYGSTREISEDIARILQEETTFKVDTQSIDLVEKIDGYDGIVVGSSVRAQRPLANVRDFFNRYKFELAKKKVALFAVCLTANCAEGREKVYDDYLSQITKKYPDLKPIAIEAFGGKIDFNKLNPVMQSLMRRVLEKTGLPTEGSIDTRDWDFIRNWAVQLRGKLLN